MQELHLTQNCSSAGSWFRGGTAKTLPRGLVDSGPEASWSAAPLTPQACIIDARPIAPEGSSSQSWLAKANLCPAGYKEYTKVRDCDGTSSWRARRMTRSTIQRCDGTNHGKIIDVQEYYTTTIKFEKAVGDCEVRAKNHEFSGQPLRMDPGRQTNGILVQNGTSATYPMKSRICLAFRQATTTTRSKENRTWQIRPELPKLPPKGRKLSCGK